MWQFDVQTRNDWLDRVETNLGASPRLQIYTGAMPANTAAAATGTLLVNMVLPTDPMSNAAGGTKSLQGSWTANAVAAGVAGYARLVDNAGTTCRAQGTVTQRVQIATTAATAAGSNVLTFASTAGVVAGVNVSGAGIPDATTVLSVTATTVTLSQASVAGVSSGVTVSFNGDIWFDNTNIASGQSVTINSFSWTAPNA